MLAHIGAISRSRHRTDAYEVECGFFPLDRSTHSPLIGLAPLEQLGLLRPGSIFEDRRYAGQLDTLRTQRVGGLKLKAMSQFNRIGHLEYILENRFAPGDSAIDLTTLKERWVNNCRHEGRTYYVPSGEIFRFYFGGISLGAASFMSLAVSDQDGVGLVDPEHTRFLEPDVLQIAPMSGLADRSSALQLALLLHSPELMAMWRTTVDQFVADQAFGSDEYYAPIELPASGHPFILRGLGANVQQRVRESAYERGFMTWSIVSDYRPTPFRRLVIKLPHGMSEIDLEQVDEAEDEPGTRYANILPEDMKLESRRRPGLAAGRMSSHMESLQRAFPRLAGVQVEYEAPPTPRSSRKREALVLQERVVEELSALMPGHDRKVGGVILRPGAIYRPEASTQVPTQRLFDDPDFDLGEYVPATTEQARYPFPTFISAFNLLMRHQAGGLVGQNPISAFGGDVMVLKPSASWARRRAAAQSPSAASISIQAMSMRLSFRDGALTNGSAWALWRRLMAPRCRGQRSHPWRAMQSRNSPFAARGQRPRAVVFGQILLSSPMFSDEALSTHGDAARRHGWRRILMLSAGRSLSRPRRARQHDRAACE